MNPSNQDKSTGSFTERMQAFALFEKISAAVFITQNDDNFIWGNQSFYRLTGYDPSALTLNKCRFIIAGTTQNNKMLAKLLCKDQTIIETEIGVQHYHPDEEDYLIHTVTDVSAMQDLKDEIIFQENKYHTLFENSLSSIIITTSENRKISEANAHAVEHFGYSIRELKQMSCDNLVLRDASYDEYLSRINQTGYYTGKITCLRKNGEYFKVNMSSWAYCNNETKEYYICHCFEDISQNEKLATFLSDTNQMGLTGYFEFNFATGINSFSPTLKQIIEVPQDFVPDLSRDIVFYKEGESRDTILRIIQASMKDGTSAEADVELITAKGKEIWVRVIVNAEFIGGKCNRLYGTFQDINNQKLLNRLVTEKTLQLNKILESVADIILVIDKEGKILLTNEAVAGSWGYRPEELIGRYKLELVHPDDQPVTRANNELSRNLKTSYDFENRHLSKDGRVVPMSWSSRWDAEEEKYYLVGRNITERIQKEEEIKFLSLVASETMDAAVLTNNEGKITWVNKSFETITGYTLEEVINKTPESVLHGPDTDVSANLKVYENISKGLPFTAEMINYRKDGKKIWIQTQAHPLFDRKGNLEGWFAIERDITDQKSEEQKLKLFQLVIENANDIIIISDAEPVENGGPRIVYVNKAFEHSTGYSKAEAIGRSPRFLQGAETDRNTPEQIRNNLKNWEPLMTDIINYKKTGEKFWNRMFITPVADNTGWFTNWIAIQRDVTEEKEAVLRNEKEKEEREKEITRALLKGEDNHRKYMSMELHDNIAQLLIGIKLYLSQYIHKKKEPYLTESLQILESTIDEVRNLSHNLAIREIDEKDLLRALRLLLDKLVTVGNMQVNFQADINQESISGDLCTNIYRITQEQVNNIIKHSRATEVIYELVQEHDSILLTIQDNGAGFDPAKQSEGIGFTNIKSRVALYKGSIKIVSARDEGCRLEITLKCS